MKRLTGTYSNPESVGFLGWIEPADKSSITFVALDGTETHFPRRDATGAVK